MDPKLEKPLAFMDKKTFQKKKRLEDPPQVFRVIKVIRVSCVTSVERTEMNVFLYKCSCDSKFCNLVFFVFFFYKNN